MLQRGLFVGVVIVQAALAAVACSSNTPATTVGATLSGNATAGASGGGSAGASSGPGAGTGGGTGAAGGEASGSLAGTGAQGGASGTSATTGAAASGSASPTSGAAGSPAGAGTSSGGGTGGTGSSASGSGGASGVPSGLGDGGAASTNPGGVDPGTTDDGDYTIGPKYTSDPSNNPTAGNPQGHLIHYQMLGTESTIYPGITGNYMRDVDLYVPQQYVPGTPAPFIVVQDGVWAVWLGRNIFTMPPTTPTQAGTANLPVILDNLIAAKKLPTLVALFVGNGGGDSVGSERGLEYDTVSGLYAEFVEKEVLPRAITEAKTQLSIALAFSPDPQAHMSLGGSSGGAASFSMAWWHPDYFQRAITYSATLVNQVPASSPFPHGCWVYHDVDPFTGADAGPNGLIMQHCAGPTASCQTPLSQAACMAVAGCTWEPMPAQPLRIWLETAQNDLGAGSGPYRDFRMANMRTAAALKARGYHYHFDYALGAGHFDGNVVAQTLPTALEYVWRGYGP